MPNPDYVILGAGVLGLTTALELRARHPSSSIHIIAKHVPGDRSIEYTSPSAGANWSSVATDNGPQESWDEITYHKFEVLADHMPESGVRRMELRCLFHSDIKDAGVLSQNTGKVWFEKLVGGLRMVDEGELRLKGAAFGWDMNSFVINVQVYLPWLQCEVLKKGIEMRRQTYDDIRMLTKDYPNVEALFNCTGLGSYHLKGVEDKLLYPTRGQVMLVENPQSPLTKMYEQESHAILPEASKEPLNRMYVMSNRKRVNNKMTYVFPRLNGGGVILGGCRIDHEWNEDVDLAVAEGIKKRCCALAPQLGKPEDLKVIQHIVGLRPSRKGGARIERTVLDGSVLIHNYGAGGTGYQSSWGMAKNAVDLLQSGSCL